MKKIIISMLLIIALLLTGCSCTPETSLSFTSYWSKEDVSTGYTESCEYKVEHIKDFNEDGLNYTLSDGVEGIFEQEYEDGIYTTFIKVLSSNQIPEDYSGDIEVDSDSHIIYYETNYSIKSKFRYGETADNEWTEENEDSIVTKIWFCSKNASYTPLYSITKANYSVVMISENVKTERVEYESKSIFSKDGYTIDGKEYEKTFKTYVDNNQLLFALRNINIDVEGAYSLPTASIQYGSVKNLTAKRMSDINLKLGNVAVEGTDKGADFNVDAKRFSFRLESTLNSGKEQLVYVNASDKEFGGKAVLLRYVAPLGDIGSFLSLGAMRYTLTSFSTTNI